MWALNLWGAVLPMVALLLLMVVAAERVAPGYGLPAGVLLACGSLLLPFSTLFFDHVLSATLGFAAFVTLLLARERERGGWWLVGAGLLAGLAVVAEFPLGIVAVILGAYAAVGARAARRVTAYASGFVAGLLPLLAYNAWAFGSPWTLGYTNALKAPAGVGAPIVGANNEGFYGVGLPDPRAAVSLLVSEKGLFVVAPLVVAAAAGLPLLWRARRLEAAVCGAVPLLFIAYNAAYYLPFGGQGPGPRFLVPALPFLALPLALALRARPLVVAGVGAASVCVMVLATVTDPLTGVEYGIGTWLHALGDSDLVETVPGLLGVQSSWPGAVVVALLVLVACAVALAQLPRRVAVRADGVLLAGVLCAWLLFAVAAPGLVPADAEHGTFEGLAAAVLLGALLVAGVLLASRLGAIAFLPLIPAVLLATPPMTERPRWSLLVVTVVLVIAVGVWARAPRHAVRVVEPAQPDRRLASPR